MRWLTRPRGHAKGIIPVDVLPISARGSGSFGELALHRFLEGQQLLHARPLQHVLEMRHTVLEARQVEFKLPGSPLTPEEMRVRRREVIEEELTAGQKIIGDLEQLHQVRGRELFYALFGSWNVADSWRGIDACQEWMNAT